MLWRVEGGNKSTLIYSEDKKRIEAMQGRITAIAFDNFVIKVLNNSRLILGEF